ncbi:uncharacterized protein UTRI_06301 [Ustilago trichophora]|uniref:Uncharacterized protein n=1 Tax=Ustilago trichophora TaxID=86804 RepID=A0A5C3ELH3_9BASI|nr:uncharacterized protein UTRI_06301 [Ustilago trichophora]
MTLHLGKSRRLPMPPTQHYHSPFDTQLSRTLIKAKLQRVRQLWVQGEKCTVERGLESMTWFGSYASSIETSCSTKLPALYRSGSPPDRDSSRPGPFAFNGLLWQKGSRANRERERYRGASGGTVFARRKCRGNGFGEGSVGSRAHIFLSRGASHLRWASTQPLTATTLAITWVRRTF